MSVQGHDIAFYEGLELGESPWIMDVGANVGEMAMLFRKLWPDARIECFEPNPTAFERLVNTTFEQGHFRLHPVGLSEHRGTATLYHNGGTDEAASLHARDLRWAGAPNFGELKTDVRVQRLDEYMYTGDVVDLLKIDAEGHELAVLRGAGIVLHPHAIKRITFEFNSCNLDSRTFLKDFWDLLVVKCGYSLFQIDSSGEVTLIEEYNPALEDFAAHREFIATD